MGAFEASAGHGLCHITIDACVYGFARSMAMVAMSQRGFRDWLIQRISAILIGSYAVVIVGYLLSYPNTSYTDWMHFYDTTWMRIFTIVALVSVLWHAWIGLWTVFTDYVKPNFLRLCLNILLALLLMVYLIWCLDIFWA